MSGEDLFEGEHLVFKRRKGWEYVEHRTAKESVMVFARTDGGAIVLVEEFRPAVETSVFCFRPDSGDEGPEDAESAARRKLSEETGYEADALERLGRGPGSAGMSSEIVNFYFAPGVRLAGPQGARESAEIRVHVVPLTGLAAWAREREAAGVLVDPKVWAGLCLARLAGSVE